MIFSKERLGAEEENWLLKALVGLTLGALFTVGVIGSIGLLVHADPQLKTASSQLLRWLFAPLWVGMIMFSVLFQSVPRAWWGLGIMNLFIWFLYFCLRSFLL
ncbi:hypothetical protein [Swingsia samuiensis]|uniref:Uncharacterized protein n=1 Tax=Swingsia samuiensis TaxID=1293412 RepID=A0A4Y6UKW4_9PROT|nr:hypothetical protein [Swingsia samuiensis]QDH16675.1 hypothetical protein E3D00_03105 [Swingsia samuiensis]